MSNPQKSPWFLYLLQCGDQSFYTGIAKNLERRIQAHQIGKGSRYTKAHQPVQLVFYMKLSSQKQALRLEAWVKRQSRNWKKQLIKNGEKFVRQSWK
jgi:predicted GIY-YIG superfamily endonuclease